jgi:hypothetical protein
MSHVATVQMEIKDLDALDAACKKLGLEFRRGQKTFKWYGTWVNDYAAQDAAYKHGIKPEDYGKCEHAIGVAGNSKAYEAGLVPNKEGDGYKLIYDFWAGGHGLIAKIGDSAEKLLQEYAKQVTLGQATSMGYLYEETTNSAGEVVITLSR